MDREPLTVWGTGCSGRYPPAVRSRHGRRFVLVLTAFLLCVGCQPAEKALGGAYPSAEALASSVLEALARSDREKLEGLALSESEFRERVWPELPAARPERNLPADYVWRDLSQKSRSSLASVLEQHGGTPYVLRRIAFARVTEYSTYRVHRDATFHVTDPSGSERTIRACGSLIEAHDGWKVFSYVVD
jgi:hypothetical protein